MVDPITTRILLYRMSFLGLTGSILFLHLLPLQTLPARWPAPDLLICLTFAWVLRRPEYVTVPLLAIVMLAADMLFMRPPGLMAALVVLGTEFLRGRNQLLRELPFPLEWAMVAGVMLAITLANRLVLLLVMVERPPLGLTLLHLLTTLLAYPLVVLVSRYALGVRKVAPGEVDALGHRL